MKLGRWITGVRKWLKRKPPIWETPEWDEMSWEEKMAIWRKHRKINIFLSCVYLACFVGSLLWVVKTGRDAKVLALLNIVMFGCIYAAMFLLD